MHLTPSLTQHLTPHLDSTDSDTAASSRRDMPRAGLRMRPAGGEPTGAFVVIEMTVLVLVAALAMVSIIVSGDDWRFAADAAAITRGDVRPRQDGADRLDANRADSSKRRATDPDVRSR